MPADVSVDARRVLIRVRVHRMRCPVTHCERQTFREQVPGLLERYERRTVRLREQVQAVVGELAGRDSARVLPAVGIAAGRDTALRTLLGIAPPERAVRIVLGIDDFALRRGRNYATVLIDADTGARIDVVPGCGARTVADWLRAHPEGADRVPQRRIDSLRPGRAGRAAPGCPGRRPVAPLARPGRGPPRRSARTRHAGRRQPGCTTGRGPAPRQSAGPGCSGRASDCWSAPGGWASG